MGSTFGSGRYQVIIVCVDDCVSLDSKTGMLRTRKSTQLSSINRPVWLGLRYIGRVHMCRAASKTTWFHTAGDVPYRSAMIYRQQLWTGFNLSVCFNVIQREAVWSESNSFRAKKVRAFIQTLYLSCKYPTLFKLSDAIDDISELKLF